MIRYLGDDRPADQQDWSVNDHARVAKQDRIAELEAANAELRENFTALQKALVGDAGASAILTASTLRADRRRQGRSELEQVPAEELARLRKGCGLLREAIVYTREAPAVSLTADIEKVLADEPD